MGDLPSQTNLEATRVNAGIDAVMNGIESAVEAGAVQAIAEDFPFLELPIIKQIVDAIIHVIVEKFGRAASIQLQQIGTFVVIDTQVTKEKTGVSDALAALMLAEKSGDADATQKAIQDYARNLSALSNSDGSAAPLST